MSRISKKITHFEYTTIDNYQAMLSSTSKGRRKPRKFELSFIDNLNNTNYTFELNYTDLQKMLTGLLTHVMYSKKNFTQMEGQRNRRLEKGKAKRKLKPSEVMRATNV